MKVSTPSKTSLSILLIVGALIATGAIADAKKSPRPAGQGTALAESKRQENRKKRFTPAPLSVDPEASSPVGPANPAAAEFDGLSNGFVSAESFDDNRASFEEVEVAEDGLGPTYNAQSCRECHQNVLTGGASQVTEQRTGHMSGGAFFESQGGSLIQSRATYPEATELVAVGDDVRTFRISTNTLGLGYVEAISNTTLLKIRDAQPESVRGAATSVPVLEAGGAPRVGRFGWKAQHASLQSFAADAYLNEMGVTSPLLPDENTISGTDPAGYDPVADPEDNGDDVVAFADFMRATKAPPRGAITQLVTQGEQVFTSTGCASCHVASITTAPAGTAINGGRLLVQAALGNKIIHAYSDFLMHDVGTGDGIPIQPTPEFAATANQIRTAPLWGLRTRNRLMHDGLSFTREEAIMRHGGQAKKVIQDYRKLSQSEVQALVAFLNSL
jgi:CxxC motif-containing protein (DUF1111 family)